MICSQAFKLRFKTILWKCISKIICSLMYYCLPNEFILWLIAYIFRRYISLFQCMFLRRPYSTQAFLFCLRNVIQFVYVIPMQSVWHLETYHPYLCIWNGRPIWATTVLSSHDDVIKWKHFPRYWPFVWGIHRSPVNSPHKGQWRGALIFY